MHHKKMDKLWDYPDDVILLPESFHVSIHTKFKSCLDSINKIENQLVNETNSNLITELEILNSKKNSYIKFFDSLQDDPEVMIFLEELNNRIIKFGQF